MTPGSTYEHGRSLSICLLDGETFSIRIKYLEIKPTFYKAMRQIVIDELSPMERDNLDSFLKRTLKPGPVIGIYWFILPSDLHSEAQQGHDDCGPFYLAVELENSRLCFELLVRSTTNLHCSCIAYVTPVQRQFILDFIDKMLAEEMIKA